MRVVDQATRNDVRSAQLDKLEADNYNEDQVSQSLSQHIVVSAVTIAFK
jgi:transposase